MKKKLLILMPALLFFTFSSCDDQVNPKSDFKQIYSLNCVIKVDSSYQVATVTRSYDVNGFDPSTNSSDPFMAGATVKVRYNDTVFVFRDTSIARVNDPRYSTPLHFYYSKKLRPQNSYPISIEADLPDGTVLKANSQTFSVDPFYFNNNSSVLLNNNNLTFYWGVLTTQGNSNLIYYAPELVILYSKIVNGTAVQMQKKVPFIYQPVENGYLPVYPPIQTGTSSLAFLNESINRAMTEISQDDPDKQNYLIDHAVFRLLILDKNLAAFYAAQRTFLDEFSVRFDQVDYTNVSGGLGIFGTFTSKETQVEIAASYVNSFGYRKK